MDKSYMSLWLLLATAFAFFVVSSVFNMPTVAGYKLKSSGLYEKLFEERDETKTVGDSRKGCVESLTENVDRKLFPVECDTMPQTILLIGDSMLEGLGPRLAAYADENGHSLYMVIWYSSTSEVWGKSERLRHYIGLLHPTYIVLSLGANELFVRDIAVKREDYVKKIIADMDSIPYLWIGPPNWKQDTGINDLIEANTPEGAFFRSDGMSFERAGDGAHPTRSSAAEWADSIARWMPEHSRHPIRMKMPKKQSGKPVRTFIHSPNDN